MSSNRREFLKLSSLAGISIASTSLLGGCATAEKQQSKLAQVEKQAKRKYTQRFNMSGYSAPKLNKVRIGFVGLGMRGPGAVYRMSNIEGVEIKALCDLIPERAEKVKKQLQERTGSAHNPTLYSGKEDSWKMMCERDDIDLIYITTPWHLHTPQSVYAMEHGKHAATEVPAATSLEECWQLVETSERTQRHCMMLENCCYDFFEILTLNMARQGYFGEIIHGEGAYIHQLVDLNFDKNGYQDMWRLKQNMTRNGNLYPTHGLGPICQVMNINRGDVMDYLTAVQSDDFMMFKEAQKRTEGDPFYKQFVQDTYRGNMNTTTIRTKKGRTIMIQHDVTSPRPYSRIHLISGTKGIARKWPEQKIATGHSWLSKEAMKALEEQYTPQIVKKIGEMAKQIGGHGGMDFMMDWRLIDCLRNGLPLDQDVYDAASWTSVGLLSEWSVANRSNSIDVPDFTAGAWQTNMPVNLSLAGGGTTSVRIQ
ncbi:oxidoreductase family protein [Pontibacter ummariensis]|uniref:Oxidoreductase family, NAD-binding Rossmann fold n=1 Tax=Pontibacter ummariensis TaxID=1610492 RepID=A0A239LVZ1_9BACT|nr:Gfo/Idh/MocA family oxidoreductase [Pontibacter ummariensis]PRY00217.1 oxidoreductase family protein [Pontibacter ummariensis]SNT34696.1 Oxidoreductase family, NAD-binding Rossmann fold [Pontibacter ummariensis]